MKPRHGNLIAASAVLVSALSIAGLAACASDGHYHKPKSNTTNTVVQIPGQPQAPAKQPKAPAPKAPAKPNLNKAPAAPKGKK